MSIREALPVEACAAAAHAPWSAVRKRISLRTSAMLMCICGHERTRASSGQTEEGGRRQRHQFL